MGNQNKIETITLRLTKDQLRMLDLLRRQHADLPSRGQLIRLLIEKEAKAKLKGAGK
jgi:hypothetical protein